MKLAVLAWMLEHGVMEINNNKDHLDVSIAAYSAWTGGQGEPVYEAMRWLFHGYDA
jgi:hypothetical protein